MGVLVGEALGLEEGAGEIEGAELSVGAALGADDGLEEGEQVIPCFSHKWSQSSESEVSWFFFLVQLLWRLRNAFLGVFQPRPALRKRVGTRTEFVDNDVDDAI